MAAEDRNSVNKGSEGGIPAGIKMFQLTQFKGLNTQSPRMSIDDEEMSWCENFFPIGPGNLQCLYDQGADIYSATGGKTIPYFYMYNIGSTQYAATFLSDGTAYQINVGTMASTTISATASTFYTGTQLPCAKQYGNKYLLISNNNTPNDYWIWDGSLLYTSGTISPIITVTAGGSGYTTGATAAITGGSGSGATASVQTVNNVVTTVTVTNPGSGFKAGDTITVTISPVGAGSGATATGTIMPFGNSGTEIEMFLNRVHLANGAKIQITDPGSVTAFNTTITSTDSFLKQAYIGLEQTNGFIYVFADSSVNDLTNEVTTGGITTLNNSNADPQVGTPWRDSIVTFGRDIVFANTNGIYVMYGGAAEKVSGPLDGIFKTATLPISGNTYPSAAIATIFGIKVYMILLTIVDVFTGTSTPKLLCWDGKKWFIASQKSTLTFIGYQENNSELTAYGTDGTNIFPLFQTKSSTLMKKGKTKLWSGDSYLWFKQALRAYLESFSNDSQVVPLSATIDTDTGSSNSVTLPGGNNLVQIINGSNLLFITNGVNNLYIIEGGISVTGQDAPQYGRLLGVTFTATGDDFVVVSLGLTYRNQTFFG